MRGGGPSCWKQNQRFKRSGKLLKRRALLNLENVEKKRREGKERWPVGRREGHRIGRKIDCAILKPDRRSNKGLKGIYQ